MVDMRGKENNMNVLLINGSPNAQGCTFTALSEVAKELEKGGVTTEILHVGNKDIHGCIGCRKCKQERRCIFHDIVNDIIPKFAACDGIIIGSPVYYASANGTLIAFLDRLFYSSDIDKTMKLGAAVVSCRRGGASATFDEINKYFTISGMPVVSSQYWNSVHGNTPAEVLQDVEGLQIMRTLGRNMVFLLKSIEMGKQKFGLPEREMHVFTNFIR